MDLSSIALDIIKANILHHFPKPVDPTAIATLIFEGGEVMRRDDVMLDSAMTRVTDIALSCSHMFSSVVNIIKEMTDVLKSFAG
jgi:hypothetical protein